MRYIIEEEFNGKQVKRHGCVWRPDGSVASVDSRDGSTRVLSGKFIVTVVDLEGEKIASFQVDRPSKHDVLERVKSELGEHAYTVLLEG